MSQLESHQILPPESCQRVHLGKDIVQIFTSTCLLATIVSLKTSIEVFLSILTTMEAVSISDLPSVVINQILENEQLSIPDVINFCSTSKHFRGFLRDNNQLWRIKFFQR